MQVAQVAMRRRRKLLCRPRAGGVGAPNPSRRRPLLLRPPAAPLPEWAAGVSRGSWGRRRRGLPPPLRLIWEGVTSQGPEAGSSARAAPVAAVAVAFRSGVVPAGSGGCVAGHAFLWLRAEWGSNGGWRCWKTTATAASAGAGGASGGAVAVVPMVPVPGAGRGRRSAQGLGRTGAAHAQGRQRRRQRRSARCRARRAQCRGRPCVGNV